MSQVKYIAAGFVEDADKLLIEFVKENSKEFSVFSHFWKKHNFSAVFLGRSSSELQQFTHEIFQITLRFMTSDNLLHQIGAVYLLYALFRNQVVEPPTRIRVTFTQYDQFMELRKLSVEERYITLHYVIGYLMEHGFDYVACASLVGPRNAKHSMEVDKKEFKLDCMLKDLKEFSSSACDNDLLKEIQQMSVQYSELTKHEIFKDAIKNIYDFELNKDFLDLSKLGAFGGTDSEANQPSNNQKDKEEESIGLRRSQIKANAFASRAWFKTLHPENEEDEDNVRITRSRTLNQFKKERILSDDEDEDSDEKEAMVRRRKKTRPPKDKRKVGRPKNEQDLERMLMTEAGEHKSEGLKCARRRGPVTRSSYLDGYIEQPLEKPNEEISILSSTSEEFEEKIDEPEKEEISNKPEKKENSDEFEKEKISDESDEEDLYKPEKESSEKSEENSDESDSDEESSDELEELITIEDLTF